jgi:hypothetical protein
VRCAPCLRRRTAGRSSPATSKPKASFGSSWCVRLRGLPRLRPARRTATHRLRCVAGAWRLTVCRRAGLLRRVHSEHHAGNRRRVPHPRSRVRAHRVCRQRARCAQQPGVRAAALAVLRRGTGLRVARLSAVCDASGLRRRVRRHRAGAREPAPAGAGAG